MLSYVGWLNGLSALVYTIFGCSFGVFLLYRSIKLKSKLLSYLGLTIFFAAFLLLGPVCDFLTILLTGNNLDNSYGLVGILSAASVPPAIFLGIYLGAELMIPKKKRVISFIYLVLSILFELFILFDTANSLIFTYPENPGDDIIDSQLVLRSPAGILAFIFLISLLIFNGFGFLIKSIQSTGVIRKKFLFLSIGYILYITFFLLDTFIPPGIGLFLIRIGLIGCFWLWYLGIKEESVKIKIKKLPSYKVPELKESQLSLIERLSKSKPIAITVKEVSLYREQKICLVCKGKVSGFNIYICPNCDTLYCQNCAVTLATLENMCWICKGPIDESQPIKPYKKEEEKIGIKKVKKGKKSPK